MKIKNVFKRDNDWDALADAESELRCRECYSDFQEVYCFGVHNLCMDCCPCDDKVNGDGEIIGIVWKRGKQVERRYLRHPLTSTLKKQIEKDYGFKL
jgi:hypothetical protein